MQINRRDFLISLPAVIAAVGGVVPISQTLANDQNKPININSYGAKRVIWLYCDPHGNLPKLYNESIIDIQRNPKRFSEVIDKYSKTYPIRKWPELKKIYPHAFKSGYRDLVDNTVEVNANYIVEVEITDRVVKHYSDQITKNTPKCNKEFLNTFLNIHLFPKVRESLYAQKGLDKDLEIGDSLDTIDRTPEIFTNYTEHEANEIFEKLTGESPQLVLQNLLNKHQTFKRYFIKLAKIN